MEWSGNSPLRFYLLRAYRSTTFSKSRKNPGYEIPTHSEFRITVSPPPHHILKITEEPRIRNPHPLRIPDNRIALRSQPANRKRHGDAVIAETLDLRSMQLLLARNLPTARRLLHVPAH